MAVLVAPVGHMAGRRRALRLGHVLVTLEDVLEVTWEVPESDLGRMLPSGLRPWSADGRSLLSALVFRNRALRPARVGWPRLNVPQMNLRSYVLDPQTGAPSCVFFHGLHLDQRWLARLSSRLLAVPFVYLPLVVRVEHEGPRVLRWEAASPEGRLRIRAREDEDGPVAMDPDRLDLLTNPHTGYVRGRDGRLRTWSIWHRNQTVRTMRIEEATVGSLADLGALGPPVSALYVASVDYEVYLPARPVELPRAPASQRA